jgi:putative ABC transport system ATP-binding protein
MTTQHPSAIRAIGVTKIFGEGAAAVRAVNGIDLTVSAGELVLIMGPSGSGKTTLLTMLGGLLRPTSGTIEIDGVDIASLDEHHLVELRRTGIGFIFQSFNLWDALTVLENVELPLNMAGIRGAPARQRAEKLLEDGGLAKRLKFRSRDLSGGEKQRVSIARALANEPRLLLADEPTANLDSKHGHDVMRLLHDLSRQGDRAVVVVSHDQRIREVADRVLWLEDGKITNIGTLTQDPVCGMSIDATTSISIEWHGRSLHFCSAGCRWEFEKSPERFTPRQEAGINKEES